MRKLICYQNPYQWHRWYAWHPITTNKQKAGSQVCYTRVWLEYVLRQYTQWDSWEYRNEEV